MKALLLVVLLLGTVAANAKVCGIKTTMDFKDLTFVLILEDGAEASDYDEWVDRAIGGNPNELNCENLIHEIKNSGKKHIKIDGQQVPMKLIHVINL